jgi:hypothetical protein
LDPKRYWIYRILHNALNNYTTSAGSRAVSRQRRPPK